MNPSRLFIERPVATTLLTIGIALAGVMAYALLPVSPLPQVDIPTIFVSASLPGASPDTMAATVATPLERALGRIAGVNEMTSSSSLGSSNITLQFDLNRDIDGAARDVQAAINAARNLLPTGLPSNPTYRKVNPADAPILILSLTSDTLTQSQMFDAADTILAQKIAQVTGVGNVNVGGGARPAVRVELNPAQLNKAGIGVEAIRNAIASTNANRPKGVLDDGEHSWQIYANDQSKTAVEYRPLIVAYNNGAPVRLGDVAQVIDSNQDLRNAGLANGKPAVILVISRQPNANIIETVDRVKSMLPIFKASIPAAINLDVLLDRTPSIRASLRDTKTTLLLSVALVILVVYLFLGSVRAALIPSVAVPVSLIGTFGAMYLLGYSLNIFSLMALTIATGFVVDDAIVVLENAQRHIEDGMKPFSAAMRSAQEVGFTVLSMSISLIAVFLPILLLGGLVGRLFREFAVTLSVSILVSLVVSLTTTPMMCAYLLKPKKEEDPSFDPDLVPARAPIRVSGWRRLTGGFDRHVLQRIARASSRAIDASTRGYTRSLGWALAVAPLMMLILLATVVLNVYLYAIVPKGFFPQQDTGLMGGAVVADQDISFQAMRIKLQAFADIVTADPAVTTSVAFTGGGQRNSGNMFVALKPLSERKESIDAVIARLRIKTAREPGATLYFQAAQDVRTGGRAGNAQYQYTLQADDINDLRTWEPKIRQALMPLPQLADVNTDTQDRGLQTSLVIDRDAASRLGVNAVNIDTTLNDLFGQRQVSTIYNPLNQYKVVMEAAPQYWQSPDQLRDVYVAAPGGSVPLASFAKYETTNTALRVSHQGEFVASTITFNLPEGTTLSQATTAIENTMARIGVPASIHGGFQGTAKAFQDSLANGAILIVAALLTIYIVLGILYESLVHPITILSTLPSAGVGALLALLATDTEFSIIALIGVFLLIGIVKKNAIMMIDFAIARERDSGMTPRDAILEAATLRFRPIMMTTVAALFGAVAARARRRRWRRDPQAARHRHRRRSHRQPGADAVHDTGRLSLSRSREPLVETPWRGASRAQAGSHRRTVASFVRSLTVRPDRPPLPMPLARTTLARTTTRMPRPLLLIVNARLLPTSLVALLVTTFAACTVGPDYRRPTVETPATFKENAGWIVATPADDVPRGAWWNAYRDPDLDALEEQSIGNNQTIAQAEASYRAARTLVDQARAAYFPVLSANGTGTRSGRGNAASGGGTANQSEAALTVSWEIDLWGRVRRQVEAQQASVDASAAELANIALSIQAAIASDYFQLRQLDTQLLLLTDTMDAYRRSLEVTRNRYAGGVAARVDVAQAETQLKQTQVSAIDLGTSRAQLEHAIALLLGKPASSFSIPAKRWTAFDERRAPSIPASGMPSQLLERRPDIANAERNVAASNAQIGVAKSAYFPALSLTGQGGFQGSAGAQLFSIPARFWSIGPQLAQTVFDAGLRRAQTAQAVANYDASVAGYRQTVLAGFADVEDQLAALRILEREAAAQDDVVASAREALALTLNQYKAGTVSYLNVVTEQATALQNERNAVSIFGSRMTYSVALVKALGGGWTSTDGTNPPKGD